MGGRERGWCDGGRTECDGDRWLDRARGEGINENESWMVNDAGLRKRELERRRRDGRVGEGSRSGDERAWMVDGPKEERREEDAVWHGEMEGGGRVLVR